MSTSFVETSRGQSPKRGRVPFPFASFFPSLTSQSPAVKYGERFLAKSGAESRPSTYFMYFKLGDRGWWQRFLVIVKRENVSPYQNVVGSTNGMDPKGIKTQKWSGPYPLTALSNLETGSETGDFLAIVCSR